MSDSVRDVFTSGLGFSSILARVGVPKADEVSVAVAVEDAPRRIANPMLQALANLSPEPADRAERSLLLGELHELWLRCQAFYDREMKREYALLLEEDEAVKASVNAQRAVVETMKRQLNEDMVELVRLQNAATIAANAAQAALDACKLMSRFSSRKEIAQAERHIAAARQKYELAQGNAARHHEAINLFQNVTLRQADQKLIKLMEAELQISAKLEGRDPAMVLSGVTRDSELKAQRFI